MATKNKKNLKTAKMEFIRRLPLKSISIILSVVLSILAIISAGFAIEKTDFLKVKNLTIEGNNHLKNMEILKLLNVNGKNLITLDEELLSRRLQASPWTKSVILRKELPGTLIIKIKEKDPVAILKKGNDEYYLDTMGTLLDKTGSNALILPVITLDTSNKEVMDEALKLSIALIKNEQTRGRMVEIKGTKPEDLAIRINSTLVLIGFGEYEQKIASYLSLKDEIAKRNMPVEYIDVRFANRLIVKTLKQES
ncbi:MAG: FtsQ-type POTRA domain-containing protein [Nitrospirae bacterium]|nr:FtsQ-type POTRA domain-containing protein [Nitrospirota bacterium]